MPRVQLALRVSALDATSIHPVGVAPSASDACERGTPMRDDAHSATVPDEAACCR